MDLCLSCFWCVWCLLQFALEKGCAGTDCDFGVSKLWSTNLREHPITAPPLLFDVDGDGYDDVVVPSFTGELWGIHGENGHIVDNWPFYLEDRAFHSGSLVYDINQDGILEFLLVTTDAEVLFVQTDNILLHGEAIKIPPLRVKRRWHQEDPAHIRGLKDGVLGDQSRAEDRKASLHSRKPTNFTPSFSEFDSRFGRHADPLFSRHEATPRLAGLDPTDQDYVFVDPHVLTTPIIADTDGDGVFAELVVAVSYYFDPYRYGDLTELARLNGLEANELVDFVAGGVVVLDLNTGEVKGQRLLGITRGIDNQPAYLLATPTVVRLTADDAPVIIIGSVTGELHVMDAGNLKERDGFPVLVDSITAQVVVGDLFNNGRLDLVVGDRSGNLFCVDGKGQRVWERELDNPIAAAVRLADLEGDGLLEVVLATHGGDVWVLNGQTGADHTPSRYPLHLNSGVETPVLVVHMRNKAKGRGLNVTLGIVIPTANLIYIVDTSTGCLQTVPSGQHIYELAAGDVDPYNPGLELLGVGLDGTIMCFNFSSNDDTPTSQEQWSMEQLGVSTFTHKASFFHFFLPFSNSSQEVAGTTFDLPLTIYTHDYQTNGEFSLLVTVGHKYVLWEGTVHTEQRMRTLSLTVSTPPTPIHAFVTVQLCSRHMQCMSKAVNIRFNLHAEDHLKWFLCLPFLCLCVMLLWIHRDHTPQALPTTATRKHL